MDLYDDLLVQLLVALGAALFAGNALALIRRRADARSASARRAEGRSGASTSSSHQSDSDLDQAPVARTITYMVVGFVVMLAGIGSLLN